MLWPPRNKRSRPQQGQDVIAQQIGQRHAAEEEQAAMCSLREDRIDLAIAGLRRAVTFDPARLSALQYLGVLLVDVGELEEAATVLRRALDLAPANLELHRTLGSVLVNLGRLESAEAVYLSALALNSQHAPSLTALGAVLVRRGQLHKAEGYLLQSLQLDPTAAAPLVSLAEMNYQRGTLRSAVEILAKAIERLKVAEGRGDGEPGGVSLGDCEEKLRRWQAEAQGKAR